jgi:hypothetical protein
MDLKRQPSQSAVPGVQPAVIEEEFDSVPQIVRKDPRWQAAMKKRVGQTMEVVAKDLLLKLLTFEVMRLVVINSKSNCSTREEKIKNIRVVHGARDLPTLFE